MMIRTGHFFPLSFILELHRLCDHQTFDECEHHWLLSTRATFDFQRANTTCSFQRTRANTTGSSQHHWLLPPLVPFRLAMLQSRLKKTRPGLFVAARAATNKPGRVFLRRDCSIASRKGTSGGRSQWCWEEPVVFARVRWKEQVVFARWKSNVARVERSQWCSHSSNV